ncbi:PIN domain-containing protein [Marinomonas sp. PE14-40]|uniref:PIN domain-containing protein n=1 Tax=Marinomonas sp. PE14-40 TaxID=3060621 RepID=UPI003F67CFEA
MDKLSVTQANRDGGHNVNAVNSNISINTFNGLSTTDLIASVRLFNCLISRRSFSSAEDSLDTLETINNVSTEGPLLFSILKFKLKLYQGELPVIGRDVFLKLLKGSSLNNDLKDYVSSVFIDFLSINSSDQAIQYYHDCKHRSTFCDAVYFEKFAKIDELQKSLSKTIEAEEEMLCALIRGFRRNYKFTQAAETAKLLNQYYPNENSQFLNIHEATLKLVSEIGATHFWMISSQSKKTLNTLIDDFLEHNQNTIDIRNINIAAYLLQLTSYEHTALKKICENNHVEVRKYIPNFKIDNSILEPLESILDANSSIDENIFLRVYRAIDNKLITEKFADWLEAGGEVLCESPELKVLIDLLQKSVLWTPSDESQLSLKKDVSKEQIEELKAIVGKINPHILYQLCESFNNAHMPHHTVALLEPIISDSPWPSPLVEVFAFALKANDRHQSLKDLLSSFEDISTNLNLIILSSELARSLNDFKEAKRLTEIATNTYPKQLYCWYLHFLTIQSSNTAEGISDHIELCEALKKMPLELFETYSDLAKTVLHYVNLVDKSFVSSIALKWFISNPYERAKDITELYLNDLQKGGNLITLPNQTVKNCQFGVTYTKSGEAPTTKLLVKNAPKNVSLIDLHTPLGNFLEKSKVGDETKIGIYNYKVIEKSPAPVAVFRIASRLREEHNSGEDCFYRFNTDPNDVVGSMASILEQFPKKSLIPPVINGSPFPLLVRINFDKENLVKATLDYLMDRESNLQTALLDNGETNYSELVIDSLTMIYLALGGYSKGLISLPIKLFITIETNITLSNWVEERFNPNYLSIDIIDGKLIKFDSKSASQDEFILNLRELLKHCQVAEPALYDMPHELIQFKRLLDSSHYSSLKLSASLSIPLLCLDHQMTSFYDTNSLITIANLNDLIKRLLIQIPNNNLHLAQHVHNDFVAPVGHSDIERLCCGTTQEQWLAFKLIDKHSSVIGIEHLFMYSYLAISNAVEGSIYRLQLSQSKYAEHIVNACCKVAISKQMYDNSINGLTALSAFLLIRLHSSHNQRYQLGSELLGRFCHGHFINLKQQGLAVTKFIKENIIETTNIDKEN